jgi:hypothetical protein
VFAHHNRDSVTVAGPSWHKPMREDRKLLQPQPQPLLLNLSPNLSQVQLLPLHHRYRYSHCHGRLKPLDEMTAADRQAFLRTINRTDLPHPNFGIGE